MDGDLSFTMLFFPTGTRCSMLDIAVVNLMLFPLVSLLSRHIFGDNDEEIGVVLRLPESMYEPPTPQ